MNLVDVLNKLIAEGVKPLSGYKLFELFDFDNDFQSNIIKLGENSYNFEVDIDGNLVDVYVDMIPTKPEELKLYPRLQNSKTIYNVTFAMGDWMVTHQLQKTNFKVLAYTMFGVTKCVVDFVKTNNPDLLVFFATSKDTTIRGEQQKLSMYKEIAKKHCPAGYMLDNIISANGQHGFHMFNTKVK